MFLHVSVVYQIVLEPAYVAASIAAWLYFEKNVSECPNTHGLAEKRSLTDGVLKITCLY